MNSELVKLVFTVPEKDANRIRLQLGDLGAGRIGNYSHTSFSSKGVGRFIPINGAKPAIGSINQSEEVQEERIEITCHKSELQKTLKLLRSIHPYEEPAIDIYPLISI
jgi:hypothetical protein